MGSFMSASLLTTIRDLHRRRGRERRGLALAEGVRLLEEALAAGVTVRGAAVSSALEGSPRGSALKTALLERRVPLTEVSPAELDQLADTEHPQGIVAVIEPRGWTLDDIALGPGAVVAVLDGVQDPGNVGTVLRTALGLGVAGVVALKGTADLTNPKVLRAAMGASFRLPAVATDAESFLVWASEHDLELWVAAPDGETATRHGPRARRPALALVLGNEGAGVSEPIGQAARRWVSVPLQPGVESLNVAVAAGILLHKVTRGD
jgi:TrmH family RNA methyltransferase